MNDDDYRKPLTRGDYLLFKIASQKAWLAQFQFYGLIVSVTLALFALAVGGSARIALLIAAAGVMGAVYGAWRAHGEAWEEERRIRRSMEGISDSSESAYPAPQSRFSDPTDQHQPLASRVGRTVGRARDWWRSRVP